MNSNYTCTWTAVSRPPYLTALALWPLGYCGRGGGLFLSQREMWLNHGDEGDEPHPEHVPQGRTVTLGDLVGDVRIGEDEPVESRRMLRDGWSVMREWQGEFRERGAYLTKQPKVRCRQNPHASQTLTMESSASGYIWSHCYTISDAKGLDLQINRAEWADWDQSGRLVFSREGKLFGLASEDIGRGDPRELVDLNGNKFEPVEAPDWAKEWPKE
jgi:hypothetical protein